MRTPRGAWPLIVAAVFGVLLCLVPTASARPKAPAGLLPANGVKLGQLPIFTWAPIKNADHYEFQLSADKGFNSTVKTSGGSQSTRNTALTIPTAIASGTYWWRIRDVTAASATSAWTKGRSFKLGWAPVTNVTGPADGTAFTIPPASLSQTLVLRWAPMPGAAQYLVSIATDPLLASLVPGTPATLDGTSYTLDGRLTDGTYYWSVTPVDAEGNKGLPSPVRSFTEHWQASAGVPTMTDIASGDQLLDPLFSWSPVFGASDYEIEISTSQDFAPGSKVCCGNLTTATQFSPTALFQDNQYFWRVRPYDSGGIPGPWTVGAPFTTTFDNVPPLVAPAITNIHMRDMTDIGSTPAITPVVEWDPVMGASAYQIELDPFQSGSCNESNPAGAYTTALTAWAPFGGINVTPPTFGGAGGPRTETSPLQAGFSYCVKVRAVDTDAGNNAVFGDWTYVNNYTAPLFTYTGGTPSTTNAPCNGALWMCASYYVEPSAGAVETQTPAVFVWKAVTGANGYYIVISKDPNFTNILDYAYTNQPTYTPRDKLYADETSPIYWAVLPTATAGGGGYPPAGNITTLGNKQFFTKQSQPPTLTALNADGSGVSFQWDPQIGAAYYSLQVSTDSTYSNLIEDIQTDSASYTAAKSYPAGQTLWYRIRVNDVAGNGLTWATGTFTRALPVPTVLPATGDVNPPLLDGIPTWGWNAVPGAVSYDVHVDYPNGTGQDANGILPTTMSWNKFDGPGIWHWKVRADFPTGGGSILAGSYSPVQTFTRTFGEPQGRRTVVSKTRLIFSWASKQGAKSYHLQVSTNPDFSSEIDDVTQDTTSFAPGLTSPGYANGGRLLWRVAAVDAEGNQGDWSPAQRVVLAKGMKITGSGTPAKGQSVAITITADDANGKPIKAATVRVAGSGTPPRAKRTNKKGVVILKVRPTSVGKVTFQVTKSGYQLGKLEYTIS